MSSFYDKRRPFKKKLLCDVELIIDGSKYIFTLWKMINKGGTVTKIAVLKL